MFLDSSVLISCGRWESKRFQALAREARQRDTVFQISPGVYDELNTGTQIDVYQSTGAAVDRAIEKGWMEVTDQPDYTDSEIATIMDQSRRYIADATNRTEDIVEKTDTEIVGLALQFLIDGAATQVVLCTNDIPLGKAAESLIPKYGFDETQIAWNTGGELTAELDDSYTPEFD